MMIGIALPEGLGLEFYQGPTNQCIAPTDSLQDEHLITQIFETDKNKTDGKKFLDQIICPPEDSGKTKLNSNDTVVKNLRQLDVDNSSSEGHSINSNDTKRRKREEDGKLNFKKKKNQKTSHPPPMP
ncbi:hypothetical protein Ancab_004886 [Ancistrocladus abbreviatus]